MMYKCLLKLIKINNKYNFYTIDFAFDVTFALQHELTFDEYTKLLITLCEQWEKEYKNSIKQIK